MKVEFKNENKHFSKEEIDFIKSQIDIINDSILEIKELKNLKCEIEISTDFTEIDGKLLDVVVTVSEIGLNRRGCMKYSDFEFNSHSLLVFMEIIIKMVQEQVRAACHYNIIYLKTKFGRKIRYAKVGEHLKAEKIVAHLMIDMNCKYIKEYTTREDYVYELEEPEGE